MEGELLPPPSLSIITAVHNQLPVNRIFWHYLSRYTESQFELIVIDNASTDGSAEFFASVGAKVIRNLGNYSYAYCQNQGLAVAKGRLLAFLNNDIIVSPSWDKHLIESMACNELDVVTCCGIEQLESDAATRRTKRRWRVIKGLCSLAGINSRTLATMHRWMYGNDWEGFCSNRYQAHRHQAVEGFVGNTVMMTRSAVDKLGAWDERIQGADFDLYLRSKRRAVTVGDIRPVHIALDTFNHHFIRLTRQANPPRFADASRLVALEEKWSPKDLRWLEERPGAGKGSVSGDRRSSAMGKAIKGNRRQSTI